MGSPANQRNSRSPTRERHPETVGTVAEGLAGSVRWDFQKKNQKIWGKHAGNCPPSIPVGPFCLRTAVFRCIGCVCESRHGGWKGWVCPTWIYTMCLMPAVIFWTSTRILNSAASRICQSRNTWKSTITRPTNMPQVVALMMGWRWWRSNICLKSPICWCIGWGG